MHAKINVKHHKLQYSLILASYCSYLQERLCLTFNQKINHNHNHNQEVKCDYLLCIIYKQVVTFHKTVNKLDISVLH